jgi:Peptidase family M23
MATSSQFRSAARLADRRPLLLLLLLAVTLSAAALGVDEPATGAAPAGPTCAGASAGRTVALARTSLAQVRTVAASRPTAGSYDWPVRPFNRQHPVRAFFNDPRMGRRQHVFHFGIDIAARDGAGVYAVAAGRVWVHGESVAVVSSGRVFGYWHVLPAVSTGQNVAHHQLLGYVGRGWGHVHFAESHNHQYRNPLRAGALGPYSDATPPTVAAAGAADGVHDLRGRVTLVASAFDTTIPRVGGAWRDEPVTPVLVRWRLVRGNEPVLGWRTAADFRQGLMPGSAFDRIYSPATRQNHRGVPGLYCFNLARDLDTRALANGDYRLQVAASDTRENRTVASVALRIANDTER